MAKVTLSRLFEVSKYLATDAGKDLKDALVYISEFVEVTTRNLRNGLTYGDNFDTTLKQVTIKPDTEQVILSGERRRVKEVVCRRAVDATYYVIDSFGWKYNTDGDVVIKAGFTGSPPATQDIILEIMLHFG
jgi:hypothetical protein